MKFSRRFIFVSAGIAAMAALPGLAAAQQAYPSKPITMIVPFAAGGSTDVIGRILSERMRVSLGQPIIIENATGAGGTIGVGRAVRAAPDGYTISLGQNGSHVITGATYNNLSYNLLTDFEPVSLLVISPFVITATKATPANNLRELISYLKAKPGARSVTRAWAASRMSPAWCSRRSPAPTFNPCPIAAPVPPCRIWWRGKSTS